MRVIEPSTLLTIWLLSMKIGKNRNKRIRTWQTFFLLLVMTSCRPKENQAQFNNDPQSIKEKANAYLDPLLHIGESTTNLIQRFGSPTREDLLPNNELCLSFFFCV